MEKKISVEIRVEFEGDEAIKKYEIKSGYKVLPHISNDIDIDVKEMKAFAEIAVKAFEKAVKKYIKSCV